MPTGTVMMTYASTAPPDTLLLQGQTVLRVDYLALWTWASAHGAVTQEAFGPGNGTTTFTLPNMQGVVPIGAGTGQGGTYTLGDISGAATRAITTSNLPLHSHAIFADGSHQGHNPFTVWAALNDTGGGIAARWDNQNPGNFANNTGATGNTGSGSAFDVRQPTMGMNWLIYI